MFRDIQVVLDPPLHGVFTYEDTVSGKVVFQSPREEKVAWVYVFFHGWANTHVVHQHYSQNTQGPNQSNYKDKDVLFQTHKIVYQGYEKLTKNNRYEWPFQFRFLAEEQDASTLPSSGKYGNSSIEYKIIAVPGHPGQSETHMMAMMNPDDKHFLKEAPISPTGIFLFAAKHLGGAAEQELQFVKIRPEFKVDGSLLGPMLSNQEIGAHHLPEIQQNSDLVPKEHGLFSKEPHISFDVGVQIPRNIIEGAYFPLLLNVSSRLRAWTDNPPSVTLVALKIHLHVKTTEKASQETGDHLVKLLLLDARKLSLPLGSKPVNVAQIFPILLTGDGVVPSFYSRLLRRTYDLAIELTLELAGKSFHVKLPLDDCITLLSRHVAGDRPPTTIPGPEKEEITYQLKNTIPRSVMEKITYQLQNSYIGKIIQESPGPIQEESIFEAAVAISRSLTKFEVPHQFPGGSLIKLIPYKFYRKHANTSNFDTLTDSKKIQNIFEEDSRFKELPVEERFSLKFGFFDPTHGENISLYFPTTMMRDDAYQEQFTIENRSVDDVRLDPVSLFNYRLSCAITREKFGEVELGDLEALNWAFGHELHSYRKRIDINTAKIALGRNPSLAKVLGEIGVDFGKGEELERRAPPPAERTVGPDYEQDLVHGFKKHFFHRKH